MDREKFLARSKSTAVTSIELDDGTTVHARKLSAGEVETCRRKYATDDKALEGYRWVVCRTLADESGNRVLRDEDVTALAEMGYADVEQIATAVLIFSGVAKAPKA